MLRSACDGTGKTPSLALGKIGYSLMESKIFGFDSSVLHDALEHVTWCNGAKFSMTFKVRLVWFGVDVVCNGTAVDPDV